MMNETRVNLKHLLEDIRDSYAAPLEEAILTELIANALDSKASAIDFVIDSNAGFLRCVDNGNGMKRAQIREYHNIATSTKARGTGIGFAGVGAKLALLLAERVVTESKGGYGSHCATEWRLAGPYRAPWKFVPFSGNITASRGTSVTIYFSDNQPHILNARFVTDTIVRHFYPLLDKKIFDDILKFFYKTPVTFTVNNSPLVLINDNNTSIKRWFRAYLGRARQPIGVGYIARTDIASNWLKQLIGREPAQMPFGPGLWISTFGKVIKGGWEWLGILPKNHNHICGLVEIPALAEILTTNKSDFLSDASSLKKYYKYRRAAQEAILPILQAMGENQVEKEASPKKLIRPMNRTVTQVLTHLIADFPELESLIGSRRERTTGKVIKDAQQERTRITTQNKTEDKPIVSLLTSLSNKNKSKNQVTQGERNPLSRRIVRAPRAGLTIALADITDTSTALLGRIIDDVLTINTAHPAWKKSQKEGLEEYHILLSTALVFSEFLEIQKTPQEFINRFLQTWALQTKEFNDDKPL